MRGSLAHDAGLFDAPGDNTNRYPCFALRSAEWAMRIAREANWDKNRVTRLADAVTLNLNGTVPQRRGVEARLLMLGVLADVTGIHRWRIHPQTVRELYTKIPVLDQQPHLADAFNAEANQHAACRGHFATHRLGFGILMRHTPRVQVAETNKCLVVSVGGHGR